MTRHRPYRPFPSCPHTYGVRHCLSSAIATEPCRPTACVRERPCPHNGQGGRGETPSYRALAPIGAGDIHWAQTATAPYSSFYIHHSSLSYTFSAKERDPETGLSYFGSRYYSSDLSIWLSVDPMSDCYPDLSPYVYCNNNPLSLIDFYGEDFVDFMNRLLEEPPHPPTDQNNPQELPEVVITPKPSSNTSSKNENVALNTKSKATVLTLPYPFVLENVFEFITAVNPVRAIIYISTLVSRRHPNRAAPCNYANVSTWNK